MQCGTRVGCEKRDRTIHSIRWQERRCRPIVEIAGERDIGDAEARFGHTGLAVFEDLVTLLLYDYSNSSHVPQNLIESGDKAEETLDNIMMFLEMLKQWDGRRRGGGILLTGTCLRLSWYKRTFLSPRCRHEC